MGQANYSESLGKQMQNIFARQQQERLAKKKAPYPDLAKLTIDQPVKIPAGEEKVFEDQEIYLTADVYARGTLIFPQLRGPRRGASGLLHEG